MPRSARVSILVLLTMLAPPLLFSQSHGKAAWPAYVLAAVPGFGLGHLYCGDSKGLLFFVGDTVGFSLLLAGSIGYEQDLFANLASGHAEEFLNDRGFPTLVLAGAIVSVVSHVLELADIFRAVDDARKAGKIAEVVPTIDVDVERTSFSLRVSLRY